MLKHTLKYQVSHATTLPTTLGGSEKDGRLKQNQINLGKENLIPLQVMGSCPFFYYSQVYLIEIITQTAHRSAIPSV